MHIVSDSYSRARRGSSDIERRGLGGQVALALVVCGSLISVCLGAGCASEPVERGTSSQLRPRVVSVDAGEAARLLAEGNVTVLDIRTPGEFSTGHITGATNVDFNGRDFADELARLDRDRTYLLHCASGRRSTASLATFERLDFRSIVHLDGGMKAWQSGGHPVEK